MDNAEFLSDFLEESSDLVEKVKVALSRWNQATNKDELINDIYRWVHTIKGGCAVFEFKETSRVAHALETRLGELRIISASVTSNDLQFISSEMNKIEEMLRHQDISSAPPEKASVQSSQSLFTFRTLYFESFYEDSKYIIQDMIKDGYSFIEIIIPESIFEKVKLKLQQHGIFDLQEISQDQGKAVLLFVNLSNDEEIKKDIDAIVDKFHGKWCHLIGEENIAPLDETPIASIPMQTLQPSALQPHVEVLRVPLASVNSILDNIWELFLLHNQMSHLMKQNILLFKENHTFLQQFEGLDTMLERTIHELESKTMSMRMSPIKKVLDRMAKVVQDYCSQNDKQINFITSGEGIDLDKKVLDTLNEPLIHLIRNAIDHGIESRLTRLNNGKAENGTVELSAQVSGNEVHILLKDDGKGIDPKKILESAKKKNLETSHLKTEQDIIGLIFEPGFSTAEEVSDVSGRGVGMDAVRKSIHELGGEVSLDTKVGFGTTFRIILPLSMSVAKSLIVKVRELQYAFSTKSINSVEKIEVHELKKNGYDHFYSFNNELIPCYDLGSILPDHRKHPDLPITHTNVCVITHHDSQVAFRVDEIIQTLNVVMKPMPRLVPKNALLSGVSILPDGNPIFVLNVFECISLIQSKNKRRVDGKFVA